MSENHLLSNALSMLRNAQMAKHKSCIVKYSTFVLNVLKVLKQEGFISEFEIVDIEGKKNIIINLSYHNGSAVINKIKMISKPSCRMYYSVKDLPQSMGGLGLIVVSTSHGVLSSYEAKQKGLGGECLFEIY